MSEFERLRTVYSKDYQSSFTIGRGLTPKAARMLPRKSHEEHIRQFTPKDFDHRFTTAQQVMRWQRSRPGNTASWRPGLGGHAVYSMLAKNGDLAGLAWCNVWPFPAGDPFESAAYEKKDPNDERPLPDDTMELRVYAGYTGRGLAKLLAGTVAVDYANSRLNGPQGDRPPFHGLWVEMAEDNSAARQACLDLGRTGYSDEAHPRGVGFDHVLTHGGRTLMMLSVPTVVHLASIEASRPEFQLGPLPGGMAQPAWG